MKKFLILALAIMLIFPTLKVSAAIVTIPNFEEIDASIEPLGAGAYICHDHLGDIHVDEYVDLLESTGNFQWVEYYTNEYDIETWLLKYTGFQKITPLINAETHIQISANEYVVNFLLSKDIKMED